MDNSKQSPAWDTVDVFTQNDDYVGLSHYIADMLARLLPNVGESLAQLGASYATRRIESGYNDRSAGVLCAVPIDMMARLGTVNASAPHIERLQPGRTLYRYVGGDPAIVNMNMTVQEMLEFEDDLRAKEQEIADKRAAEAKNREVEEVCRKIRSWAVVPADQQATVRKYAQLVVDGVMDLTEAIAEVKKFLWEEDYVRARREYDYQIPLIVPGSPRKAVKKKDFKAITEDDKGRIWTNQSIMLMIPEGARLPAYMDVTPGYSPNTQKVYQNFSNKVRKTLEFAGRGTGDYDYYVVDLEDGLRVVEVNRHALALIRKFHPKGPMRLEGSSTFAFVFCDDVEVALLATRSIDSLRLREIPVPEATIVRDRYLSQNLEVSV